MLDLTHHDRALLARAGGLADPAEVPRDPRRLDALLRLDTVAETVLSPVPSARRPQDPLARASPHLVFAVAVSRTARDLAGDAYIQEWFGPRRRVPVFVDDDLRSLLEDLERRLFLTELLTSYLHVASGAVWVSTPRGRRRRRFNELDVRDLAGLLDVLPSSAHDGLHRRLGDLCLFLTGVFPDRTSTRSFGSIDLHRLGADVDGVAAERGAVGLLEHLGARWYRLADVEIADRFVDARRALNHLTDRYLFPFRDEWFPLGG